MSYENKGSMPASATVTLEPDRSGNFVCSGAADDVEAQAAVDYVVDLGGGRIHFGRGTFSFNNPLTLPNDENLIIDGEGWNSTTLQTAAGGHVIDFALTGTWSHNNKIAIRDMMLDTVSGASGACINAQLGLNERCPKLLIDNLRLRGKYGLYIHNFYRSSVRNVRWSDSGIDDSIGIYFATNHETLHLGDSYIAFIVTDSTGGGTTRGIHLETLDDGNYTLTTWHKLMIYGADYGVDLEGAADVGSIFNQYFTQPTLEGCGVDMWAHGDGEIRNINVEGGGVYWSGDNQCWLAEGQVRDCTLRNITMAGGGTHIDEAGRLAAARSIPNYFINIDHNSRNIAGNVRSIFRQCNSFRACTENTATILNGNNNVVVAHNMDTTPSQVVVSGHHAEVETCYSDTIGAANFTIHAGGAGAPNVTANRDVSWRAVDRWYYTPG